jgi:DNA invertase Pin-like site-specific DNA recombinase
MKIYGYLRTSTDDQVYGIEAQRDEILAAYPEAVFCEEHASGKAGSNRPEFDALLDRVCAEKAVLVVSRLDRLGRSTIEVLKTLERVTSSGGNIVVLQMGVDTRTTTGKLVITVLAAVAEMERSFIQERVVAGLAQARATGKQLGGARRLGHRGDGTTTGKTAPRSPSGRRLTGAERTMRAEVQRFLVEGLTVAQVARLAGCSESLVRKVMKQSHVATKMAVGVAVAPA